MKNVLMLVIAALLPLGAQAQATTCNLDISDALIQLFGVPAIADMSQAFALAFVTPMTVYLAAYLTGCLVNFWNR